MPTAAQNCTSNWTAAHDSGRIPRGETVLFVHTGGTPALFHYREALGLPETLPEAAMA